jgi:hypothetical protein
MSLVVVMRTTGGLVVGLEDRLAREAGLQSSVTRLVPLNATIGMVAYGPGAAVLNAVVDLVEEVRRLLSPSVDDVAQLVAASLRSHQKVAQTMAGPNWPQAGNVIEAILVGPATTEPGRLRIVSCTSESNFIPSELDMQFLLRVPERTMPEFQEAQFIARRLYFHQIGQRNAEHLVAYMLQQAAGGETVLELATLTSSEGFKLVQRSRLAAIQANNPARFDKFHQDCLLPLFGH